MYFNPSEIGKCIETKGKNKKNPPCQVLSFLQEKLKLDIPDIDDF